MTPETRMFVVSASVAFMLTGLSGLRGADDGRDTLRVCAHPPSERVTERVIGPLTDRGQFTPAITLPSGGDTSYPGLLVHEGRLWVSYYSSHEGKTSIYLARIPLPELAAGGS